MRFKGFAIYYLLDLGQVSALPGGSDGKESACKWSLGWEDLLEKELATQARALASNGGRAW